MPHHINSIQLQRLLAIAVTLSLVAYGGGGSTPTSAVSNALPALQASSTDSSSPATSSSPTRYAYVPNYDTNDVSVFKVNASTSTLTWVSNVATGTGPGAVVVDATGALTRIGSTITAGAYPMGITLTPTAL